MQFHSLMSDREVVRPTPAKSLGSLVAVIAVSMMMVATAQAVPTVLYGVEDNEIQTQFTLNFPDLGLTTSSKVVATRFDLEIDEETGTARFTDYIQLVEPLLLPLGISTGPIQIRIVSSQGTYNTATRVFETNDEYEITFANDLSFFGFDSPVVIPSISRGTVDTDGGAANARSVGMTWEGSGEMENSDNPSQPFKYSYVCESTTLMSDPASRPPLPSVQVAVPAQFCGTGTCGGAGLGMMAMMFAGMGLIKVSQRRQRRR